MGSFDHTTIDTLRRFSGGSLTRTVATLEGEVSGLVGRDCGEFLDRISATQEVLAAAATLKSLAGQINVIIHALGILRCLPHILEDGEIVESASLGAGNTGRAFDLETSYRVAEFKFISWQGGPESIRQNSIFKDLFLLSQASSSKRKELYVLGAEHPMRFLRGGRAMSSVLSKDEKVRKMFYDTFGERFRTVREYYAVFADTVSIVDASPWLPELIGDPSSH